jgi:phosphatidylglycerol:prolipoprotein diacylglycerol transferase
MLPCLTFAVVFFPGVIRLGSMRVSVFGFFAAAGLIAAVALSQRTARLVRLDPQRVWDAGVWAIVAAFVLSRVLLVVEDPKAFLRYPLIVLSLPSLTYEAMALTVVATVLYLRWKRLPILDVLDAWTPPAALLAGVLALAHFVEGTDAGMPTSLPWGVVTPGDTILGRVHPVQLYLLIAAVVIGGFSYRALLRKGPGVEGLDRAAGALPSQEQNAMYADRETVSLPVGQSASRQFASGAVAARAMIEGGLLFFILDMFAQPYDAHSAMLLDPGQYVGLGCVAVGVGLWFFSQPVQSIRAEEEEIVHA